MASIFSKIINREIPAFILAEDEAHIAFLDVNPVCLGHALCVPKAEVDYIYDLSPEALSSLMVFSQKVAWALRQVVPCKRIGVSVIGLEVPHAHVHLLPLNSLADTNFAGERYKPSPERQQEIVAQVEALLAS